MSWANSFDMYRCHVSLITQDHSTPFTKKMNEYPLAPLHFTSTGEKMVKERRKSYIASLCPEIVVPVDGTPIQTKNTFKSIII